MVKKTLREEKIMKNNLLRKFIAITLVGVGVMLILDNLNLIKTDIKELWHYVYPTFFIIFGLMLIIRFLKRESFSWIFGSFLIIFGALLLLGRLDIISYQFRDIIKLWPLLIIYIGFSLFKNSNKRKGSFFDRFSNNRFYNNKNYGERFGVGGYEFKEPNWEVESMNLSRGVGDYYFDFTQALISDDEITIHLQSSIGNVHIILPENLEFKIESSVKVGKINVTGQKLKNFNKKISYTTDKYNLVNKKINFFITLKVGSIQIDRV